MQSFFQTNPLCAEKLYQKVIDYLLENEIPNDQIILDLFCGTGTISQLIARHTNNKVIGVDIVNSAIENANENAQKNKLLGLKFICADVGKFLLNNPEYQNKIHTIVIDPPRAGIAPKTLRKVIRLNAKIIIYVSCNPATQARDLVTLNEMGYDLDKFSLVDQFPHTSHIESIMVFRKSSVEVI
jgi:23S rRNA (uracil-5-)-methyltransferase RumA